MFIDFMGDKAGIRLKYCSDFRIWSVKNGMLTETQVKSRTTDMYENEVNDFIRCIKTGDKNQQYIDYAVETSKILQAIYDSSEANKEIIID
jgi:predicted dehydrogenase